MAVDRRRSHSSYWQQAAAGRLRAKGTNVKYMFLIYQDEATNDQSEEMMGRWWAFDGETRSTGVNQSGEALHPVGTAKTVRVRGGKPEVTDGPFAETKEQLGGYYILDVPDLDAAIEWAKKFPNVGTGSVEIRPVVDFSGMQP